MAGFRLNDGSGGCPPTATPPSGYTNAFRQDSAGNLWLNECFRTFHYFGVARHDIASSGNIIGGGSVPTTTIDSIVAGTGVGISAGTYVTKTITNSTPCTLQIMLGYDMGVDATIKATNWVQFWFGATVNGAFYSACAYSSVYNSAGAGYNRYLGSSSANPHDTAIESGSGALSLAPGASMNIGARFYVQYRIGAPDGFDVIDGASSIVRIYGYSLDG